MPYAHAEQLLTTTITQPTIDRFIVEDFRIDNKNKAVLLIVQYGYDDTGTFVPEGGSVSYLVTNEWVKRNNSFIARPDATGTFTQFPAAYQTNPANEMISQVFAQGSAALALAYLETAIKQLGSL